MSATVRPRLRKTVTSASIRAVACDPRPKTAVSAAPASGTAKSATTIVGIHACMRSLPRAECEDRQEYREPEDHGQRIKLHEPVLNRPESRSDPTGKHPDQVDDPIDNRIEKCADPGQHDRRQFDDRGIEFVEIEPVL